MIIDTYYVKYVFFTLIYSDKLVEKVKDKAFMNFTSGCGL